MGLPMHGLQAEGMSFLFRNLSEKMEIVAYGNLGFGNIGFEIFGILRTILITSITTQRNMVIVNDPLIGLIQQYTSTLKWVITTKIGGKSSQTTSRTSILNNTVGYVKRSGYSLHGPQSPIPQSKFSQTSNQPRTAQRTTEQWTTPITPRYVPRSVSLAMRVG